MAKKALQLEPAQILTFPFQEENWLKKTLIASLLVLFSFIPVIPLVLLLGYAAEIIRGIAVDGKAPSLPEWDDLSSLFTSGFRLFGVGALYMIPSIILIGIGSLGFMIPIILLEIGMMSEAGAVGFLVAGYIVGFGFIGVGAFVSILTALILPVAGTHVVVQEDFRAAFKLREIWAIYKANWGGFLVAFLIMLGTAVVLYVGTNFLAATVILCCLYPFSLYFVRTYLLLIGAGFFGNAYRISAKNLPG